MLAALLIAALVQFCWSYNDEPWVIEANGASIVVPTYGEIVGKALTRNLYGALTKEQTETLASAMMIITDAVLYSNFQNWTSLKGEFSNSDVTFFHKYILKQSIKDQLSGFHAIRDWSITPTTISFTLYRIMRNDADDGYGADDKYYHIKIRYYFAADDQGHWAFLKNEVIGFSRDSKE